MATEAPAAEAPVQEPEVREVAKQAVPNSVNSVLSQWGDDVDD